MQEHWRMPNQIFGNDQAARMRQIAQQPCTTPSEGRAHLVSITSGKGGVGKSTISLNLAIALADLGKRVLVFDADMNLGNIDIMLGIVPRFCISNVLRGEMDIEDVLISPCPGLYVLPGGSGGTGAPLLNAETQNQLIEKLTSLEEPLDIILCDTSAGLTPEIVTYVVSSDETILVTSTEPTAIMDAYAVIKVVSSIKPAHPLRVLFNNVRQPSEAEEAAKKLEMAVEHFLGRSITYIGMIPYDQHVASAVVQQQPLVRLFPTSGASLSILSMAQRFARYALRSTGSSTARRSFAIL